MYTRHQNNLYVEYSEVIGDLFGVSGIMDMWAHRRVAMNGLTDNHLKDVIEKIKECL